MRCSRLEGAAARLASRVELVRGAGQDLPDFSHDGLLGSLEEWLLPMLGGVRSAADWKGFDPLPALQTYLGWDAAQLVERMAPGSFVTPLGRKVPIDYGGGDGPKISVRLQELFGITRHPESAGRTRSDRRGAT